MIALSLAAFIAPLCAGCLFKYKRRDRATRIMDRFAKPYFLVCLVIVPSCALVTNTYYFSVVTWRHLLSGLLVGGLGYFIGATLAFICRQGRCSLAFRENALIFICGLRVTKKNFHIDTLTTQAVNGEY